MNIALAYLFWCFQGLHVVQSIDHPRSIGVPTRPNFFGSRPNLETRKSSQSYHERTTKSLEELIKINGGQDESAAPPAAEEVTPVISSEPVAEPTAEMGINTQVTSPPPTATSTSTMTTTLERILKSDLTERTLATIGMLTVLTLLVKKFGEKGIIALILLAQGAMYQELCSVVESYHLQNSGLRMDAEQSWQKWWWFLTAEFLTSFRNILTKSPGSFIGLKEFDLISCAMGAVSLIFGVVGMSIHSTTGPDAFRAYLGEISTSLFALLFEVGLSSFMILTLKEFGMEWIIFSVLLVATNDIMAYVFGRLVGKTKLLPRLSPKKTVEGFLGAGLSTVAISIPLLKLVLKYGTRYTDSTSMLANSNVSVKSLAMVFGAYASLIAPFGGFLASAVKRAHYAKDFGALIPGHGGVTDRVDCQVVIAPFVYLYLRYCLS